MPAESVYLSSKTIEEIRSEAKRLDRKISWIAQRAWEMAKAKLREMPDQ